MKASEREQSPAPKSYRTLARPPRGELCVFSVKEGAVTIARPSARTIADLAGAERIAREHVPEALFYRGAQRTRTS